MTEYEVGYSEGFESGAQELHKKERDLDKLKAALWKYGKHLASCPLWSRVPPEARCNCGWVEVRDQLAPSQANPSGELK